MSLRPVWPVLLVALPLLALSAGLLVRHWSDAHRAQRAELISRAVLALLVVGIGLRPTTMQEVETPVPGTTDLVLLVDRTASMGALDAASGRPRIEAAGADLAELVVNSRGANITVIVFDDEARVSVPSTTDATTVGSYLRTVGSRPSAKATGSDISVGLELARETLGDLVAANPDHRRFLVYAGDGEQTQDRAPASFAPLAKDLSGALVLGYGTRAGGVMPISPGASEDVTIKGEKQRSRIDEAALRRIARELSGEYLHRTQPAGLPEFAVSDAGTTQELRPGAEHYWWLALAGVPFLLHLLAAAVLGLRTAREESR